jgi:hypothetical protein
MSTRTDLVDALAAALPPQVYRVTGSPSCPDMIETDTFAVRAWVGKFSPGVASGSVQIDCTVWVLTPLTSPGVTDDALDVACSKVMAALYKLPWLTSPTAERAVMEDSEGPRWHGWRFDTSAFGQIDLED